MPHALEPRLKDGECSRGKRLHPRLIGTVHFACDHGPASPIRGHERTWRADELRLWSHAWERPGEPPGAGAQDQRNLTKKLSHGNILAPNHEIFYTQTMPCTPTVRKLGRDLKRWLYSPKGAWPIIPYAYASWVAGGCWVLAQALHHWIGPSSTLMAIYSWPEYLGDDDDKIPQHVVVRVADCYLDGDGASSEKELFLRWLNIENLIEPELVDADPEHLSAFDIQCPAGAVKDLSEALYRKFGDAERYFDL